MTNNNIKLEELGKDLNVLRVKLTSDLNQVNEMIANFNELAKTNGYEQEENRTYSGSYPMKETMVRLKLFTAEELETDKGREFLKKAESIATGLSDLQKQEVLKQVEKSKRTSTIKNLQGYTIISLSNAVKNKKGK